MFLFYTSNGARHFKRPTTTTSLVRQVYRTSIAQMSEHRKTEHVEEQHWIALHRSVVVLTEVARLLATEFVIRCFGQQNEHIVLKTWRTTAIEL